MAKKFKMEKKNWRPKLRRQVGGGIPGDTDTVEALLTPGEYVIRKDAVDAIRQDYGDEFLEILNHYDSRKRRKR